MNRFIAYDDGFFRYFPFHEWFSDGYSMFELLMMVNDV